MGSVLPSAASSCYLPAYWWGEEPSWTSAQLSSTLCSHSGGPGTGGYLALVPALCSLWQSRVAGSTGPPPHNLWMPEPTQALGVSCRPTVLHPCSHSRASRLCHYSEAFLVFANPGPPWCQHCAHLMVVVERILHFQVSEDGAGSLKAGELGGFPVILSAGVNAPARSRPHHCWCVCSWGCAQSGGGVSHRGIASLAGGRSFPEAGLRAW